MYEMKASNLTCQLMNTPLVNVNLSQYHFPTQYADTIQTGHVLKIIAYSVMLVSSLFGNLGVIVIAALNAQLRTSVNAYLVNLAVADVCIVVFCMWVHLAMDITHPMFVLGAFWCRLNGFAQMTSLTASVLSLTVIACDRFMAVLFPLQVRQARTKLRTITIIVSVWLLAIIVSLPLLFFRRILTVQWYDMEEVTCQEIWPARWTYDPAKQDCVNSSLDYRKTYYTLVTIALYFAPVLIMLLVYSLIIWRLWLSSDLLHCSDSRVHSNNSAKKKVVKMVVTILIVFFICWTPLLILILYGTFQTDTVLPEWFRNVSFGAYFIAYCNSFWNPILYGGFSHGFKEGFKKLIRLQVPIIRSNVTRLEMYTSNHQRANRSQAASTCVTAT